MNKPLRALGDDSESLVGDVRALLAATANNAEEKVAAARERLSDALDKGRHVAQRGARQADRFVRGHSYESAAIAFGLGALTVLLLGRHCDR